MANRELIAATLAAGLLAAKDFRGSSGSTEDYAVSMYRRILAALDAGDAQAASQVGAAKRR
jgi:DNA-binding FadR family transcriptional regulator